jgi:dTMP kinase
MAAAEPHRYVVVDADGSPDEVAERVFRGLEPVLPKPPVPAAPQADQAAVVR